MAQFWASSVSEGKIKKLQLNKIFFYYCLLISLSCSNIVGFFAKALLANSVGQNTELAFILKSLWKYF